MAQPRYLDIADRVEEQIRAGQWTESNFPTVRNLAREHSVSIVTASRAMQALRDRGLIQIVGRSGAYLIPPTPTKAKAWAAWLRLTPGPFEHATRSMILSAFQRHAESLGGDIRSDLFPEKGNLARTAVDTAVESLQAEGVLGVLLLPSRVSTIDTECELMLIERCQSAGIPVVLVERNLRGAQRELPCDLVSSDDFLGGVLATRHLQEQGCRRIGFVSSSPTSSHTTRMGGYLAGLIPDAASQDPPQMPVVLWQDPTQPPREAYQRLAQQALDAELDGMICYQDYTAVGLIMELMKRRVRVPEQISVVGFDNLPISEAYAVGVTTYAFPYPAIAAQALRMIEDRRTRPSVPPLHVVLRGELVVRESSNRSEREKNSQKGPQ
ncbi:LacI family DNA-binding transcriptional regulator [Tuwongella immobilis]|uniref:HTH gntR-type domain-containing protein n=1 Tax=Tuwongella immobilis TaxID=692036 RepID=A0A6C2YUW8_9BACT|nr:LacI family DNA-binding transcriptional regulator [Tuwongella immobilis]VIP05410.1 family transcriptional regulator : Transcriptional regulators-like protein OS=Pirellula staleyi (strain ATCC 27377 / DSM 6068 / ICPB 4128) GN=Psta_4678 PE=4 SV=1: GntR: Peripla_BP_3 [Tuwongella immobilis]VTS08176.1 family transcriptional regulator : Transcriptional regulators-like protein OS=Pirellula staleyi (strain ATCC 27377 / DSM 6068 / ICPB 4128) GN=Psta_4678 PE=4 SV=1: GntR: Peripla_BP_3 [Tuwongella immobi